MKPFINVGKNLNPHSSNVLHYNEKTFLNKQERKLFKLDRDYYTESVTYNLNSFGYRTYNSLPENYILALGCSHTYGTGLHEHERYTNLLENEINTPVVNLGRPGTAINFILLNLLTLINSNYTKPKIIICQFPNLERLTLPASKNTLHTIIPQDKVHHMLYKNNGVSTHSEICYQLIVDTLKREKIKLISFYFWNSLGETQIKVIDFARDFEHPGPKTNIAVKDYILDNL